VTQNVISIIATYSFAIIRTIEESLSSKSSAACGSAGSILR
jgi:hypothetical protein